ncbi:MAG: carboxyl transferase domain-containing protein [Spirochaetales bacterium]
MSKTAIPTLRPDSTIAIVNRGEAAVRFIRAAKEYNAEHSTSLTTVAFFVEQESEALFTKEADYAVPFSSYDRVNTDVVSPYLDHGLLVRAISDQGCDAVWAGWGFVSEDADFVEKLESEGICFLGPGSGSMAALGDKIQAKDIAEKNNVPILPWSKGAVRSVEQAHEIARSVEYPCILKAAHAGGGRGIRFVRTPGELESQFISARDETIRITGDDILFIERLVERGRHLEVQCLADRHGTVKTFGVRDCSIQRKNQKIIEETPPPSVPDGLVEEMEAAASRLLAGAEYEGAGTVEFLYDLDRSEFYFMEVNTRLQVEHPITELLYGIDLVKGQIDVAFAERLSDTKASPSGHVVEARLNAEDPDREFTPSPGYVASFKIPSGPGIRVDSGIEQGSTIPSLFDSMVAKIIAYGPSRTAALARLERALRELRIRIEGGTTNRSFLLALLANERVRSGPVHTRFVEALLAERSELRDGPDAPVAFVSIAIEQYLRTTAEELANFTQQLSTSGSPREVRAGHGHVAYLRYRGVAYEVLVRSLGDNEYHVIVGNTVQHVTYLRREQEALLKTQTKRYNIQTVERGDTIQCEVDGQPYILEIESSGSIKAPSPSIVLGVSVEPGQYVSRGDVVVTLEAMKMEMVVEAPEDGTVQAIGVKTGQQVAAGQELIQIEAAAGKQEKSPEPGERIDFTRFSAADETQALVREFRAAFLGYDYAEDTVTRFSRTLRKPSTLKPVCDPADLILDALEIYASIGWIFSNEKATVEGFAREASFAELLIHYYRRSVDREKGMPQSFLDSLSRVQQHYARDEFAGLEREMSMLLRLYRARANKAATREMLRQAIFALEQIDVDEERREELAQLLDEITRLSGPDAQALSDSAIHARYRLVDQDVLAGLREEKRSQIHRAIDLVTRAGGRSGDAESIMHRVIDSGHTINADLFDTLFSETGTRRAIALEMLARRFNRDREIRHVETHAGETAPWALVHSHDPDGEHMTVVVATGSHGANTIAEAVRHAAESTLSEHADDASRQITGVTGVHHRLECVVLCDGRERVDHTERDRHAVSPTAHGSGPLGSLSEAASRLFEGLTACDLPVAWVSVGIMESGGTTYRTLRHSNEHGHASAETAPMYIDPLRGPFNPLRYRELRAHRLKHFRTKVAYASEFVTLLEAQSYENSRDERFVALVEVPTSRFERDADGGIRRMVAFENVFMEAVYAMRAEQAKRRRRLQWNRIVIHIRSVLNVALDDVSEYAELLAPRTADLGLEKIVAYSRRINPKTGQPEEIELLFEQISGTGFSLRGRAPSLEPMQPMDDYTARVVRARQRGTIYPYELIKLITRTGVQVNERFPKGEFEEFDIDVSEGANAYISVKGRPSGQSSSNIVFGIIRSYRPGFPEGLSRVIILSDTTGDMGSLAEAECRRVNAALDLAADRDLPVEWLPVSAGARIDMESGTENLDWTAATLKRIVEFTQNGGEINIIVSGINVGAQSYWNAEATMLMHTRGLLIMTEHAAMLLTGKKALDFSGSVSAEDNIGIGGVERVMEPNGQAQIRVRDLNEAYEVLFRHYDLTWVKPGRRFPERRESSDPTERDVAVERYTDAFGQGFTTIGDIFSQRLNPERKKPFDMRQLMRAVVDRDQPFLERWRNMRDAETAIVWESRIGGYAAGLIGIESRALSRIGEVPHDGPESWSGGTLFPVSSKKIARGLNAFSGRVPAVILANLSGFDGSPESLRKLQLEYGAEIGRAIVNFDGPVIFVVVARYHGGAYVVFSKRLNSMLKSAAIEDSYASVIGGAPAAAVVFPGVVRKQAAADERVAEARKRLEADSGFTQADYDAVYHDVHGEKQSELAARFDRIHSVERAQSVGSIDDIISVSSLRPYIVSAIERGME